MRLQFSDGEGRGTGNFGACDSFYRKWLRFNASPLDEELINKRGFMDNCIYVLGFF